MIAPGIGVVSLSVRHPVQHFYPPAGPEVQPSGPRGRPPSLPKPHGLPGAGIRATAGPLTDVNLRGRQSLVQQAAHALLTPGTNQSPPIREKDPPRRCIKILAPTNPRSSPPLDTNSGSRYAHHHQHRRTATSCSPPSCCNILIDALRDERRHDRCPNVYCQRQMWNSHRTATPLNDLLETMESRRCAYRQSPRQSSLEPAAPLLTLQCTAA